MKRNTPLITLLAGAVLGIALLVASMVANPKAPASSAAAASSAPAASAATTPVPSVTPSAQTSAPQQASAPASADYAGEVKDGSAAIAVSVHGGRAIAYLCNGGSMDAWFTGTAVNGRLTLTGKNGAHLDATFNSAGISGTAVADGQQVPLQTERLTVQKKKDAGLFRATGTVDGKAVKAGWIVLQNGKTIGSIETSPGTADQTTAGAPPLVLATLTAMDGGTVLHAASISGATGAGF